MSNEDFVFPSEDDAAAKTSSAPQVAGGAEFSFPSEKDPQSSAGFLANTARAGEEAISSLKGALSEAPPTPEVGLPSMSRVPRAIGALAGIVGAPVTGALRTVAPWIAGPMATGIQTVGEPIAKALNPDAKLPTHEEVYGKIEPEVETALGLTMPGPAKAAIGPAAGAQKVAEASERLGVPVPRAAATNSIAAQSVAGSLKDIPLVGEPIVKASKNAIAGLDEVAKRTSAAYGSGDQFSAGQAAKHGLQNWIEGDSKTIASRLYDAVDPMVNPQARRPLYRTEQVVKDIVDNNANAGLPPGAAAKLVDKAVNDPLGLNYQGIKTLRTRIGELVDTGVLPPNMSKTELGRVYGALTEDLRGHVLDAGGPDALKAFDRANGIYSQIAARRKALSGIIGGNASVAPEQVIDRLAAMASSKARADISKLVQARRVMGPDAWNDVTSAVINRMGRATPGAEFSGDRFVTAWNNLSDAGKRLVFNSTGRTDLAKSIEDMATLSQAHKSLMAYGNPSGTGRTASMAAMATGLVTAPLTTIATAVGSNVMARILAAPITVKQATRWSKVYNATRQVPSAGRMASLGAASGNLARTINRKLGTNFTGSDFMRQIRGPLPAEAEQDQNDNQRPPGQQKGGRINAQRQRFADGGAPDDQSLEYNPLADQSTANAPSPEQVWGPSWTQQALEQSQRDQNIIARGGNLHDLVQNSEAAQDLASGFGGGALGITKGAGAAMAAERLAMEKAPPLYSAVERAVADAKTPQAPAQQWLGTLKNAPGVKPEELETLGVEDFLKGQKGPVTKQALAEHIAGNKVDVQEVMKGYQSPYKYQGNEWQAAIDQAEAAGNWSEAERIQRAWEGIDESTGSTAGTPKFGSGMGAPLPGGENYRELLLTLPSANDKYIQFTDAMRAKYGDMPLGQMPMTEGEKAFIDKQINAYGEGNKDVFKSGHWDEPNVLAHVRFDDRNIGGDKTLHMAEVQSDWHQKGRREGYAAGEKEQAYNSYVDDLRGRLRNELYQGGLEQGWDTARASEFADRFANSKEPRQLAKAMNEEGKLDEMHRARIEERNAVPNAPFKTTWPELALKRMIRYAAENGYDRISWDTGLTNAERYDLSKHIDEVHYEPSTQKLFAYPKDDGRPAINETVPPEKLADYIGKDVAEKLLNTRPQNVPTESRGNVATHILSGVDLKVGGEGMKKFYDTMLPNVANKLVKKYGARVEQQGVTRPGNLTLDQVATDLGYGGWHSGLTAAQKAKTEEVWLEKKKTTGNTVPVHSIKITPELRDQALHRGFPMFSTGIPIPPHSTDKRETQGFAKGGAVSGKATKAAAEYKTRGHPPRICANCQMFRPPSFCTAVKGQISPQAVCKFFEAKKGRASGGCIDASHTVRTGANSSVDGTVYVDPRIPAKFRKFLAVHETTEQRHMAGGYARAHKIATAAERKAVEASGMSWRHYTAEMDGYLDHIEHEKDTDPPPGKMHVSPDMALDHHRAKNK